MAKRSSIADDYVAKLKGGNASTEETLYEPSNLADAYVQRLTGKPPAKRKKKKSKKSAGGFFGNLLEGASERVTGLGPGIAQLGADVWASAAHGQPIESTKTGRAIAESYKQMYGPLLRGEFGEFAENVYEDPLGPILDALFVVSAGVGGAAKAGVIGKASRSLELTAPSGAKLSRAVSGTELSRRLKLGADSALKTLTAKYPDMRVLGEHSRYARQIAYKNLKTQIGLKLAPGKYNAAIGKLSKEEFIAMRLLCDFPTRKLLDEERARLARAGVPSPMMDDPKVLALVDAPTKKIEQALYEAEQLTGKQAALLIGGEVKKGGKKGTVPALTPEAASIRLYQPILIARGAEKVPDPAKVQQIADRMGLAVEDVPPAFTKDLPYVLRAPEGQTIQGMIDSIRSEIAAEGRWQPIYHPQKMVAETRGTHVGVGGRAPQRPPVHQNKAILQTMGKVAYDIDALTPSFLGTVRWALYTDRHADLVRAGRFTPPDEAALLVDAGKHDYVRRDLAETISYTERATPGFEKRLSEWFPEGSEGAEHLTTKVAADAVTDAAGNRLVIPKHMADKIVGEYVRSSNALTWFWTKPTDVWRALVLNLRVGWLTNNVVGTTLLYAIRNAGPRGLTAYFQAMSDIVGPQAVRRLLRRDKEVLNRLILDDAIDIFPEQVAGTFFGTQGLDIGTSRLARAGQKVARYTTQPLRRADIAIEKRTRLAMINLLVKKSPEFKKVYKEMPAQTRSIKAAEIKLLTQDRQFAERVSRQVNDALGDYLSLSRFERAALRSAAPFYAWYRAITLVTLKMPLEIPGRLDLLTKLGEAWWGESIGQLGPEGIEDYLRALFLFDKPKGGKVKALSTQGMNPFMTVVQEARALSSLYSGDPDARYQLRGMINPFLSAGAVALGQEPAYPGAEQPGMLAAMGETIVPNLPQVRLAQQYGLLPSWFEKAFDIKPPGPQATYKRSDISEILAYLGVPIKDVNLNNARANYYRYQGR